MEFQEAASVFGDPDHSTDENRLLTFGTTRTRKMIIVSHTERNGSTGILSARLMQKHERNIYEEG